MSLLLAGLCQVAFAGIFIKFACDAFEPATEYLGRNMPAGVKGATINAVGSSLPELLTTLILLFFYQDRDGFAAGVATCAGSAVFNAVVIPAACLLAVSTYGVQRQNGRETVTRVQFRKSTLLREVLFFSAAALLLGVLLGEDELGHWPALMLVGLYLAYLLFLWWQMRGKPPVDQVHVPPEIDKPRRGIHALVTCDFNALFFGGRAFNNTRAWVVAGCSVAVLAVSCYLLAESIILTADAMGVAPYFTALVLAAAASSIPDAILSVKDSLKGRYDDAIANAIGSNTFDIGICIGLPLLLYSVINGPVPVVSEELGRAAIDELRLILGIVVAMVLALLFFKSEIGKKRAIALLASYAGFIIYVAGSAFGWWQAG